MTDAEKRVRDLARAATPGPWVPWCDHQPSLDWLCNDKDGVSVVTLGTDGWPTVRVADVDVVRTEEEEASGTTTPANKAAVAANVSFIVAANPSVVLALLDRIEALEKQVGQSERQGAKKMRVACVAAASLVAAEAADAKDHGAEAGAYAVRNRITALPLPEEA